MVLKIICDDLIKYQCQECNKEFIVSMNDIEKVKEEYKDIFCPFCLIKATQISFITKETHKDFLSDFGCIGIYTED
jgi:DNA-directed RNA polymerase subunit RPC12/RpoP